jgi:hypothetical protein
MSNERDFSFVVAAPKHAWAFLGATHYLPPQGDFLRASTLVAEGAFLDSEIGTLLRGLRRG